MNLLFICSRNQWRSPTAEKVFDGERHSARSAGTEPSARVRVSEKMIRWADLIFVMEKRHRDRLTERFGQELAYKEVIVLNIADEYGYMDEELIDTLKGLVQPYLAEEASGS